MVKTMCKVNRTGDEVGLVNQCQPVCVTLLPALTLNLFLESFAVLHMLFGSDLGDRPRLRLGT